MAKFIFSVGTNRAKSEVKKEVEILDDSLEGLSEDERNEVIEEIYQEWLRDNIVESWEELK